LIRLRGFLVVENVEGEGGGGSSESCNTQCALFAETTLDPSEGSGGDVEDVGDKISLCWTKTKE